MENTEASKKPRKTPQWLVPAAGYSISALSLVWVFSKFPYAQLGDHLRTLDWRWVWLAVGLEIAVYFFDAWRWGKLLVPVGTASFGLCLQSVFVGLFANDVLPAKAGEVIRCFLISYETGIPLSLAFTSQIILRLMDGVWIVLLYLMVTLQIGTHPMVRDVMWGFGIGVVAVAALALFILFRRHHAHHFFKNTSWAGRFVHLLDGLHRLGDWPALRNAMLISGIYWLTQTLAIWALTRADRFDLGISAAAFLLVVKAVVTLIPNAPASMGAYQAAAMYGLGVLLVEHANAQIFAEIMFWFLTLPVAIGGALAVAFTGVDITALHRRAIAHQGGAHQAEDKES
jgi:glycosyltransferase 2 family protein